MSTSHNQFFDLPIDSFACNDDSRQGKVRSAYFLDPEKENLSHSTVKDDKSKRSSISLSACSNWNVKDDAPGNVPPYYPLEKTRKTIDFREATPSEISARLSQALRLMSIAASYNDEKATAQLSTPDHIEIIVNLFKHSNGGTIVEVQRRSGCSISFHQHAHRILDAAQGALDHASLENPHILPALEYAAATSKIKEKEREWQQKERENTLVVIEVAGKLLKKDRIDANTLGMESLFLLTQPEKTSLLTALITSNVVLCGSTHLCGDRRNDAATDSTLNLEQEDALVKNLGIRETILSLIQHKKLKELDEGDDSYLDDQASAGSDEDLVYDEPEVAGSSMETYSHSPFDVEHTNLMHNLALAVLANSLNVIEKEGTLRDMLQVHHWLGGTELLSTLIDVLSKADSHPHDACLAARCLCALTQASKEAREIVHGLGALSVVKRAKDIGQVTHVNLEKASECLYETLTATAAAQS